MTEVKLFKAVLQKFTDDFQPAVFPYPKDFTFEFSEDGATITCTVLASGPENAKKQLKSLWPSLNGRVVYELKEVN